MDQQQGRRYIGPVLTAVIASLAITLSLPALARAQKAAAITVTALDYAFQLPETLKAGPAIFSLNNKGAMRHEVFLVRLKEGKTIADLSRATTPEERRAVYDGVVGAVFADGGTNSPGRLMVDLSSDRTYAAVCFIRDTPDKPQHIALGMMSSVHVKH